MKIAVLKEAAGESRCAAIPETVKKFIALGAEVAVETRRRARAHRSPMPNSKRRAPSSAAAPRSLKGAGIILAVNGPDPTTLKGAEKGALLVGALDPVRRRERDRRLCRGRARGAGDGMDAAHHARAVDGHPVVAVEPRRLQGGGRRRRRLRPRLPDDDDRGGDGQPGQGVRDGRRSRRPPGDRHRQAARRPGQRDRRPLGDQGADPVARRQADLRRACRRDRRRGRRRLRDGNVGGISEGAGRAGVRATSPSRTS